MRAVLADAGLPEPLVFPSELDAAGAARTIAPWLDQTHDRRITAVCAYNDDWSLALLAGMRTLGMRAPDDLAIIGVDDVPHAPFAWPPLTTVDLGVEQAARLIGDAVLATIAGSASTTSTRPEIRLVTQST